MVQFPETAASEWKIVADAAAATDTLRQRLERDALVEAELEKRRIRHQADVMFEAELQAEDTPDLVMMTLADYRNSPMPTKRRDLITGVLNDDGVCAVLGQSGSGKSTLALQMMYCLATGNDFLGQSVNQLDGCFGAISYDMPTSTMFDWIDGFPLLDPNRFSLVDAHKRGNPLAVPDQRRAIANLWKARNTEVVMIDSFSASFFGRDQNDQAETQAHYRDLKKFALTEVGARCLLIIVHAKDGDPTKARGSTVHKDVADTQISVAEDLSPQSATPGSRHVKMVKYRELRGQVAMSPRVLTHPDPNTHLVDLDIGGMQLAGYDIPGHIAGAGDVMFPEPTSDPDTDSTSPLEGDDDL